MKIIFFYSLLMISTEILAQSSWESMTNDEVTKLTNKLPFLNEQLEIKKQRLKAEQDRLEQKKNLLKDQNAENLTIEIQELERDIETTKDDHEFIRKKLIEIENEIAVNTQILLETKSTPDYKKYTDCDEGTPEINLEEKVPFKGATFGGVFFDVPRDNQDGVGSCFANAAKNLVFAASQGKENPSFLDMALQYKISNKTLRTEGLDGGETCLAIEAVSQVGYCSQKYAPMETGEKNEYIEGIFSENQYISMERSLGLIKKFINDYHSFEKNVYVTNKDILIKTKMIVDTLSENPNIQLPLPIVNNQIPIHWKLRESFAIANKDKNITEETFLKEYRDEYNKKFQPLYVQAVLGKKSVDTIFNLYKQSMESVLEKYKLVPYLPVFKKSIESVLEKEMNNKSLNEKLQASIKFLKEMTHKKDLSDESFLTYCSQDGIDSLEFITTLMPLIEEIRSKKLNKSQFFNENGDLKSVEDLLQLTIAPSCLNSQNRKELSPLSCSSGHSFVYDTKNSNRSEKDKESILRQRIALNLLQGYPVGNSHKSVMGGNHINTIVGIRFDKASKQCQLRIRESQTGTSGWHHLGPILERLNSLTEVRKK